MSVLVTGGTGVLGRLVVDRLRTAGTDVRVLSRHPGPDGAVAADLSEPGSVPVVAEALGGVEVMLHLAGSATGDEVKTRHLLDAIRLAGTTPHLVYISVVGADRTPVVSRIDRAMFGYVLAKRESELLVERSGLPWTTLRATQFHQFAWSLAVAATKPPLVAMVPAGTRIQPIEAGEVADRLIELAGAEPAGLVEELGGPRVYGMDEVVRDYLAAVGQRRAVVGIRMPGQAAAAYRAGANLTPEHAVGRRTWEEFVASRSTG